MDKFGLSEKTLSLIVDLLKSYEEIEKVLIFGSRARGGFKPSSDIDLALVGKLLDDKYIRHISSQLDELPTPYQFDIVNYNQIENDNFKEIIDKYSEEIYKKE